MFGIEVDGVAEPEADLRGGMIPKRAFLIPQEVRMKVVDGPEGEGEALKLKRRVYSMGP